MEIKYENVPKEWPLCFLAMCGKKKSCLRYQAGLTMPTGIQTCMAVTPSVLKTSKCPMFWKKETMRTAVGFSHIFDDVKQRHAPEMRAQIADYLGGNGTYYRYLHGERALAPEQQQWIRDLFVSYGYSEDISFDSYGEQYRFYDT